MKNTTIKATWFVDLENEANTLFNELQITDEETKDKIFGLLLQTARNQYLAGNRAGIRWAREYHHNAPSNNLVTK